VLWNLSFLLDVVSSEVGVAKIVCLCGVWERRRRGFAASIFCVRHLSLPIVSRRWITYRFKMTERKQLSFMKGDRNRVRSLIQNQSQQIKESQDRTSFISSTTKSKVV